MRRSLWLCAAGLVSLVWGVGGYLPPAAPPATQAFLRFPRKAISVPIVAGAHSKALAKGAGNIEGTAAPGSTGNMGLAGHRDTFFRELQHVRVGDELVVESADVRSFYRVEWTKVTDPNDTSVLAPTKENALTLVTCFPFRYVGHAPQRFIVRAKESLVLRRNPTAAVRSY